MPVELTLNYTEVITKTVTSQTIVRAGDIYRPSFPTFRPLVEKLGKLTLLMSSCTHTEWEAFITRDLGGRNLTEIEAITILDIDLWTNRIAVDFKWVGEQNAVIIFGFGDIWTY